MIFQSYYIPLTRVSENVTKWGKKYIFFKSGGDKTEGRHRALGTLSWLGVLTTPPPPPPRPLSPKRSSPTTSGVLLLQWADNQYTSPHLRNRGVAGEHFSSFFLGSSKNPWGAAEPPVCTPVFFLGCCSTPSSQGPGKLLISFSTLCTWNFLFFPHFQTCDVDMILLWNQNMTCKNVFYRRVRLWRWATKINGLIENFKILTFFVQN